MKLKISTYDTRLWAKYFPIRVSLSVLASLPKAAGGFSKIFSFLFLLNSVPIPHLSSIGRLSNFGHVKTGCHVALSTISTREAVLRT